MFQSRLRTGAGVPQNVEYLPDNTMIFPCPDLVHGKTQRRQTMSPTRNYAEGALIINQIYLSEPRAPSL